MTSHNSVKPEAKKTDNGFVILFVCLFLFTQKIFLDFLTLQSGSVQFYCADGNLGLGGVDPLVSVTRAQASYSSHLPVLGRRHFPE